MARSVAPRERTSRGEPSAKLPLTEGAAAALPAAVPGGNPNAAPQAGDPDPWTVPGSVRDRFVQDGRRFYFADGAEAFRDRGRRLTTRSENTQVIASLIDIAHARGWTEVTVTGTERFREEAWRRARLAGLNVRGYRPTQEHQAPLIRTLGRELARPVGRADSVSADREFAGPDGALPVEARERAAASAERVASGSAAAAERISGKLIEHGRDAYRHDPNEEPSYFVRLQTKKGTREVWGKDIERALSKSLTQPRIGDEVILQRTGREAVTVKRQVRDGRGEFEEKEVEVYRNRWALEKREFFERRAAAAEMLRDERIAPREAVRQHPELTGTYLKLRAAEIAAKALRDPEDRRRFLSQVRGALADDIERGEPLQPVRLREKTREPPTAARARGDERALQR